MFPGALCAPKPNGNAPPIPVIVRLRSQRPRCSGHRRWHRPTSAGDAGRHGAESAGAHRSRGFCRRQAVGEAGLVPGDAGSTDERTGRPKWRPPVRWGGAGPQVYASAAGMSSPAGAATTWRSTASRPSKASASFSKAGRFMRANTGHQSAAWGP